MQYTTLSHKDYLKLAVRTMAPTFYVDNGQNLMGFASENVVNRLLQLHCVIGIVTEIDEFHSALINNDIVNIGEELADMLWYSANLEVVLKVSLPESYGPSLSDVSAKILENELSHSACEMLDIYKKALFYNKVPDVNTVAGHLNNINFLVNRIADNFGLDVGVMRAKNINKLMVRFPDKFSEVNAQVRNLDAEYEALK